MENIKYLVRLLLGDTWPVLVVGVIIMLIIAYRNCFLSRGTGRVFYRNGSGLFAFMSSIAGFFHFADLLHSWIIGDLIIVEESAFKDPANARAFSVIIAMLFGLAVGLLFYSIARIVILRRAEFMERRHMLSHIRKLSYQNRNFY